MSGNLIRPAIEEQSRLLGPVLYAGMEASVLDAEGRSGGLAHAKFPHLRPLVVRSILREFLEREVLPDGWSVEGDSRLMGQLFLDHAQLGLQMRVLKERRRSYPGGVPVAGHTAARRSKWINDPLDFEVPALAQSREGPEPLLLLWDYADSAREDFTLRIVHTREAGVYGKRVECDLILDVQDGGTIFDRLAFPESPEDDDLFETMIELDEGENGLGG